MLKLTHAVLELVANGALDNSATPQTPVLEVPVKQRTRLGRGSIVSQRQRPIWSTAHGDPAVGTDEPQVTQRLELANPSVTLRLELTNLR
ncbi:hypothetical protein RRG08_049048 [Elysia crispata]|uniref:Uncharacterized protein n=1 Tax=Elysia crispata TaxID=231223 RepID=A0AAE0YSK7_9GAST|nr:hypothetical protein RRG08_049048 [Elysia crispata]